MNGMLLCHELALAQESIPMTETIFLKASRLLEELDNKKSRALLAALGGRRRYRSKMDLLFCELFPVYRPSCFKFYRDKGPQLKDIMTKVEVRFYDELLCHFILREKYANR